MTNTWRYTTNNLDGVNWTANAYDDSGWDGSGPALLWVDVRSGGPDPTVQPKNTQMPFDPSTGYPYITYYFRTHFTLTNVVPGTALGFSDLVDDGAVFYLNGAEIYRLRMTAAPTPIANATLAAGYPCPNMVPPGDANCPDGFVVAGDVATNLVVGDNVLSAEVHNYSAASPDITFGISFALLETYDLPPVLNLASTNSAVTLNWTRGGFTLQMADSPTGPWTNYPGPVVSSPFSAPISGSARYFRLIK